jgi:preprotein translocase SecE subunit
MAITNYLREVRAEMKHVRWPTRQQTIAYAVLVIAISIAVAVGLGLLDALFQRLLLLLTA